MKLIWFSEIKWDYLKTRKQHIIENFPKEWEVLFVESFVFGRPNRFRPQRMGNITRLTIPFFKATPFPFLNKLQEKKIVQIIMESAVRFWIWFICRITGFSSSDRIIAISNVYFADIVKKMPRSLVYYDCNDFPMGFSTTLTFVEDYFKKTCEVADIITSVSSRLMQEVHRYRKTSTHIVGNGVDYELFSKQEDMLLPRDLEGIQGPILMFTGALTEWFNVNLIQKIAEAIPSASIVLVGPIKYLPVLEALKRMQLNYKIYTLGEKRHDDLPKYLCHANVCILPGIISKRTLGGNPNTLYEYLASGKPVVVRNFSDEVNFLKDYIFVAETEEEFVVSVQKALDQPLDAKKLKAIAKTFDWKIKSSQIEHLITSYLEKRKR